MIFPIAPINVVINDLYDFSSTIYTTPEKVAIQLISTATQRKGTYFHASTNSSFITSLNNGFINIIMIEDMNAKKAVVVENTLL